MSTPRQGESLLWIAVVILAVVVLLPVVMMAFAMPMMGMMGWWSGGGGPGTGLSPLWGIATMLLLLVVLLGVGYFLYRVIAGSRVLERDHALEELRIAYARGDLSDEEFEERRARLEADRD